MSGPEIRYCSRAETQDEAQGQAREGRDRGRHCGLGYELRLPAINRDRYGYGYLI